MTAACMRLQCFGITIGLYGNLGVDNPGEMTGGSGVVIQGSIIYLLYQIELRVPWQPRNGLCPFKPANIMPGLNRAQKIDVL